MDTLPDFVFLPIFDRVSRVVHFGRSRSLQEVKNRIKRILKRQKQAYQTAKKQSTVRKYRTEYQNLRKLYRHEFPERTWEDAERNPGGIVDLTLRYGRDKAIEMRLERGRRRMGPLRRIR